VNWRNRWVFWGLVAVVLSLISIPSAEWISAFREYSKLAGGWEPAPLKPTRTTFVPRDDRAQAPPTLKPVEFRLKAPKAKSVELVGDFNAWKPGLLKMRRGDAGIWTFELPVRPGRHKYLFLVDGEPRVDPSTETTDGPEGRRVSVRIIK
jgi:hypothetical protein